ncbi:MAG: peptidylprolyl isomerase [Ruminococcaceae bacterium]|nr:peptidylprolyl isomerase [Oscillospiraceae bacterium]
MASKNNKTNKTTAKEWIIGIIVIALIIAVCSTLIWVILKNHDKHADEQASEQQQAQQIEGLDKLYKYPSAKDTETEGGYYNIANTGIGVSVDMSKVSAQIDKYEYKDFAKTDKETDFVNIAVAGYGDIVIALRSDIAPKTVANFKKLVKNNFYDNTLIDKIRTSAKAEKDEFVPISIQGGTRNANGTSKTTDKIIGEFTQNGWANNLQHVKGAISMARSADRDSATSEFFFVQKDNLDLNGLYASFGYILAGMDVADSIAKCETKKTGEDRLHSPSKNIVIYDMFFVEPVKNTGLAVSEKPNTDTAQYTIKFVDEAGAAIQSVRFKMTDTQSNATVVEVYSNAAGTATFNIAPSDYTLKVISAKGYSVSNTAYELAKGTTTMTVTLKKTEAQS